MNGETSTSERPSRPLVAALAVAVLAIAGGGYWWTGSPSRLYGADDAALASATDEQTLRALIGQLQQRLAANPDDGAGWALLARSYAVLGRGDDAAAAYAKALSALGDDPDLLLDYAELLAAQPRSLAGEPTRLIERALAVAPRHPKALLLAGTAAFARGDYAAAVRHWESIGDDALGDGPIAEQLRRHIAEARTRAGLAASAPSGAGAGAGTRGEAVSGVVSLSPALAASVRPDDTLFVFARAASGPRQPLAILRKQARELPLSFTLDDSQAMSRQLKLSQFDRVVVGARISRSGDAMPREGDVVGQSAPVAPGASGVRVEIAEPVRGP